MRYRVIEDGPSVKIPHFYPPSPPKKGRNIGENTNESNILDRALTEIPKGCKRLRSRSIVWRVACSLYFFHSPCNNA